MSYAINENKIFNFSLFLKIIKQDIKRNIFIYMKHGYYSL